MNNSINCANFPDKLKLADITPVFKKGDRLSKENYRPVSILTAISKIYERILCYQMNTYFDNILSNSQCGFRKGFSAQHCLVVMLEKWKKSVDAGGFSGVLLTDLSKAFDCLSHSLLLAKLEAYGLDYNAIKLIHSYLFNRFQRVRINSNFSSWSEIICGVPQGSIMGPLLFNIYLRDLFMFVTLDIANYADDNSPYAIGTNVESVTTQLETDSRKLLIWLTNNAFKANPDKFHLLLNTPDNNLSVSVDNHKIHNGESEKLLGIIFDNDLKFNEHVSNLCRKASQKLHALSRISHHMCTHKKRVIMKSFIQSQFGYCPLVWMMHSRSLNRRINNIHKRSLRVVYDDYESSFLALLEKDDAFTVHERNIQTLAIEVFKVVQGISPKIMKNVFPIKKEVKYCSKNIFESHNVKTVHNGTETISYLGPKIWAIIPGNLKQITKLNEFKKKIRMWKPTNCPCRICKDYIAGVGFINVTKRSDKPFPYLR